MTAFLATKYGRGDVIELSGYFTRLSELIGKTSAGIEKHIGLPEGHLSEGWYLLYLADSLMPEDFEMRAGAWLPDGVPSGHKLGANADRGALQPERVLQREGWSPDHLAAYKRKQATGFDKDRLTRARVAKVLSFRPSPSDPALYGPGEALGQWALMRGRKKRFVVQYVVGASDLAGRSPQELAKKWQEIVGTVDRRWEQVFPPVKFGVYT